jgi:uncharacterized Zn-finger protein
MYEGLEDLPSGSPFVPPPQPPVELTAYAWRFPGLTNTTVGPSTFANNSLAFHPGPDNAAGSSSFGEPTFFPDYFNYYDVPQYSHFPSFNTDITYNAQNVAVPAYPHQLNAGAGPMMPQAPASLAPAAPPVTADEILHHCTKGCRATFRREGDFRRHMKSKHGPPRYRCIDVDCDKKFYRADKLRDHIRQGHKDLKFFQGRISGA